jgi:hypothetical protein
LDALLRKLAAAYRVNLLPIFEGSRNHIQALPSGLMLSGFPTLQGVRIDTHPFSHFPL